MKQVFITAINAGDAVKVKGKKQISECMAIAEAEGYRVAEVQEWIDEHDPEEMVFIKGTEGIAFLIDILLMAYPKMLMFLSGEGLEDSLAENDIDLVTIEEAEVAVGSGCPLPNALTGFPPSAKQAEKWKKRAEKRGFVPGAKFLGVAGTDADRVTTIGEDGVQVDDMGTYYGNSRIMYVKDDSVQWAQPLYRFLTTPEEFDAVGSRDYVGVMIGAAKGFISRLGVTASAKEKFALVLRGGSWICHSDERLTHRTPQAVIKQVLKEVSGQDVAFMLFPDGVSMYAWLAVD